MEHLTEFLEDGKIVVGKKRLREDGIFTPIAHKPMLHGAVGCSLTLSWDRILVPALVEGELSLELKDSLMCQFSLMSRTKKCG